MEEEIGAVAPGRLADIVAVDGDPLAEIEALGEMSFVMKDSVVYVEDGTPTAEGIAR